MRVVAQRAVLAGRRVLEKIGAAQITVAAPAQFVEGILFQQGICRRVVRIVTGCTRDDTKADWMCIGFQTIRTLLSCDSRNKPPPVRSADSPDPLVCANYGSQHRQCHCAHARYQSTAYRRPWCGRLHSYCFAVGNEYCPQHAFCE